MTHLLIVHDDVYDFLQELGNGEQCEVYLGRNFRGDTAALKYLTNNEMAQKKAFMSEVSVLSKLKHPCIVPFIGFILQSHRIAGKSCIITEYMPNDSLRTVYQKIREGEIPDGWNATTKSKIMFGIAEGMAFIHKHNTVHRDLKPENIFLDYNLEPKITDFGLSKFNSIEAQMQKDISSLHYMAPELLRGDKDATNFADIYSYGVLLLSLCIEDQPQFDSVNKIRSYKDACDHIINGKRFILPNTIPQKIKELIVSCWSEKLINRKIFSEITELLKKEMICFPGTDKDEYLKYIERVHENKAAPIGPTTPAPETRSTKRKPQTHKRVSYK